MTSSASGVDLLVKTDHTEAVCAAHLLNHEGGRFFDQVKLPVSHARRPALQMVFAFGQQGYSGHLKLS